MLNNSWRFIGTAVGDTLIRGAEGARGKATRAVLKLSGKRTTGSKTSGEVFIDIRPPKGQPTDRRWEISQVKGQGAAYYNERRLPFLFFDGLRLNKGRFTCEAHYI